MYIVNYSVKFNTELPLASFTQEVVLQNIFDDIHLVNGKESDEVTIPVQLNCNINLSQLKL